MYSSHPSVPTPAFREQLLLCRLIQRTLNWVSFILDLPLYWIDCCQCFLSKQEGARSLLKGLASINLYALNSCTPNAHIITNPTRINSPAPFFKHTEFIFAKLVVSTLTFTQVYDCQYKWVLCEMHRTCPDLTKVPSLKLLSIFCTHLRCCIVLYSVLMPHLLFCLLCKPETSMTAGAIPACLYEVIMTCSQTSSTQPKEGSVLTLFSREETHREFNSLPQYHTAT